MKKRVIPSKKRYNCGLEKINRFPISFIYHYFYKLMYI